MGGVVDAIFGGGADSVETYSPAQVMAGYPTAQDYILGGLDIGTGYSAFDPLTGQISIDPTGRNLNLGGLSEFRTNIGQTRESLLGNQGAYMNARVNPLLEQLARGRAGLQRETARTGVRGTFRDRSLLDYDIAGERAAGDARALATNETLNAISQLDQALFNASTGVGTNIFNQEMASLGLSMDAINNLRAIAANLTTGAGSVASSTQAAAAQADQARSSALSGFLGTGLTAAGMYFGLPGATLGANPGYGLGVNSMFP